MSNHPRRSPPSKGGPHATPRPNGITDNGTAQVVANVATEEQLELFPTIVIVNGKRQFATSAP